MSESLVFLYSCGVGMVMGLIFFGGLWWTLKKDMLQRQPVWGFALSFFLRTTLALLGFYWLVPTHWGHLLVSLLGFFLVRLFFIYGIPATEVSHESKS